MNPTISQISESGDLYKFTLSGLNVSLANALRRIILSEIPTVVIRTETYQDNQCNITLNTSRLHNEILKQRLSCIPIHMKMNELELLPGNYVLEVDVKNDTDSIMYATTEQFKIKNKTNGNYLTREETQRIFPPCVKTNSYIDFARLRPKISDSIPGEALKLTAEFSISYARVNSMFNVVSKCSYGNTPNMEKINEEWSERESKFRSQEMPDNEIEFHKKNYYILDAQRRYVEDSYDFVVQTVGVFDSRDIVKTSANVLVKKFQSLIDDLDSDIVSILNSETTMENCYDVILENEDYTIGKVIEYILYEKYYIGEKTLTFCGFKKFHPHDTNSTIRIAFDQKSDKTMIKQYIHTACIESQEVFKKIYKLF
jgi:DNA-directed RNA polymerase alpha subunit